MDNIYTEVNTERECIVKEIRHLTDSAFILQLEKNGLEFKAGQYINMGIKGEDNTRAYSIYSAPEEPFLEVLVKEIEDGNVSRKLKTVAPGDVVMVDGPFGSFFLDEEKVKEGAPFLFIATGTGIAPFHSFVKAFPGLNYQLLHGVRFSGEAYGKEEYEPSRFILCTSRSKSGHFRGRVTGYLSKNYISPATQCYLCGNHKMIYEAYEILQQKNIPIENIHAEVFF